jgi:hypothetical protein
MIFKKKRGRVFTVFHDPFIGMRLAQLLEASAICRREREADLAREKKNAPESQQSPEKKEGGV